LSAEKSTFPLIRSLIFFNSVSKKGDGIAKIIISDLEAVSLIEELGFIFDLSKTTDLKYLEFLPFFFR